MGETLAVIFSSVEDMEHYPYPVLECSICDFTERIDKNSYDTVIISIGATLNSMKIRRQIFEDYKEKGVLFTNAVAKSAEIRRGARIGDSCIFPAGVKTRNRVTIGNYVSVPVGYTIIHSIADGTIVRQQNKQ